MATTTTHVEQAHRLMVGLFKQDPTSGTAYASLGEADYKGIKWGTTSIIPAGYDFTNINRAGTTVETTEKAFITDLSKVTKYASGKVTPGNITLASMVQADVKSIHSALRGLAVEDPYLCLFCAAAYDSENTSAGTITYKVFYATAGILTEDGAASAEANADFTGNLVFQPSGVPTESFADNAHNLTLTVSTGAVVFASTASA